MAVDAGGLSGQTGRPRLGVIKFFLPKWSRFFVHMFSSEEGTTEFISMPKAVKEVNSWLIKGSHAGVDMSRLENDRFWVGPADFSKLTLVSNIVLWERPLEEPCGTDAPKITPDWFQCSECTYLIEADEPRTECRCCHEAYHDDCLFAFEKTAGPGHTPELLDKQGARYRAAAIKWLSRKSSKVASLAVEDLTQSQEDTAEATSIVETKNEFVCRSCRFCRYCCANINEEVIPSSASQVEPFVVCTKCNAAAHGYCVFPAVPKLHASIQWMCDDCRECNSCGRVTYLNEQTQLPSPLTDWALPSFSQCKQCFAGLDKGEYCPVCMKAWSVDWGGDMVQCDACEFWVHVSCDDLGSVSLSKLETADVKYNCPICRDDTDVHRRRRVIDLLRAIDKVGLFSEPVSPAFIQVYLKVIKQPMDLAKMRKKSYATNLEFIQDFELIVDNAKVFNMPNSPAYRLAEQFHKQGKLLIEKYLLTERKGASKIEGLSVDVDAEAQVAVAVSETSALQKRAASVQAQRAWKPDTAASSGKPKHVTYEHALEMIKKLAKLPPARPAESGLISPYKRKLLRPSLTGSPFEAAGSTTKPSSGMVTPVSGLSSPSLTEGELESVLGQIFGFSHSFFLKNKWTLFPSRKDAATKRRVVVKADFSKLLSSRLPSSEIAKSVRWSLYDSCSLCGSFGEPWNFVECADCGECFHWFCCGLAGNPNDTVLPKHLNPLTGCGDKSNFRFRCDSCVSCDYCRQHLNAVSEDSVFGCGLCGKKAHVACRTRFFADKAIEVPGFTVDRGSVCEDCVMDQALRFFKAETCKACDSLVNPNVASCYFRAMPDVILSQSAPVSGRSSPLVHCVMCGDVWHARCITEFSDVATSDITGVFVCTSCVGAIDGPDGPEGKKVDEILASMGNTLRAYRSKAYREVILDTVAEALRAAGFAGSLDRSSPLLADLIDIFQSTAPVDYMPTTLVDEAKPWLHWAFMHKDILVGLGNVIQESSRNASGVRARRIEDDDLLFVKRLQSVFQLVKGVSMDCTEMKEETMDTSSASTLVSLPDFFSATQPKRDSVFSGSEIGARLMQIWLSRYGTTMGCTGPGTSAKKTNGILPIAQHAPEVWDTRSCDLCALVGDHLALGMLLPASDRTWVHSECLAWAVPDSPWEESISLSHSSVGRLMGAPAAPAVSKPRSVSSLKTVVSQSVECAVCCKPGATVFCQSCHSGSAFHLHCAIAVNSVSMSITTPRVLMDSRCRMLTCGKCLYRHPDTERYFRQTFVSTVTGFKSGQSALNQVVSIRQSRPLVVVDEPASSLPLLAADEVVREGTLSIVCAGTFDDSYVYDGASQIVPKGYAAVRLFWLIDLTLLHTDEDRGIVISENKRENATLKKRRRVAYLCRISADGTFFSIEIIGGRVVAVGATLAEVWTEFTAMLVTNPECKLPPSCTAEWFFGLESDYMRALLMERATQSVKRQAGINRNMWLYQPQLRAHVTEALGLNAELKPVSSIRRNLVARIDEYKERIDQLASLGRTGPVGPMPNILEPALVIAEYTGPGDEGVGSASSGLSKPSRVKSSAAADASITSDNGTRYRIRSGIPDLVVLAVRRSKIHNYGLFARNGFAKGDMVVEYQGEILRQTIADEREKKAEREGEGDGGSCYMFKLDDDYVVDATVKGNCARFINHSCNPNCSCKMIEDETRQKHIMIIAKRDILPGEEITYDYQFAVESEKLACLCGAPNCLGRLN